MIGQGSNSLLAATVSVSYALFTVAGGVYDSIKPPAIEGFGSVPEPVVAGQLATVHWRVIKRANCPGYSARVWNGTEGFSLAEPLAPTSLPFGEGEYNIPTRIPEGVRPGNLELTVVGYFECPDKDREHFSLTPLVMQVDAS